MPQEVRLPFQERWRPLVLAGAKTTTVRTRRYGAPGDTFTLEGRAFVLTRVEAMPLARARELWREEGMASPEEFEAVWRDNHPARGYQAGHTVWVHWFAPAETADRPRSPVQ